jgi:hypothetical protein
LDVTRATGLSERFQRELLKNNIITAIQQARTKKRLVDRRMIMRMTLIAQFNNFGLSLSIAGQIISECQSVEDYIFQNVDPICLPLDNSIPELSPASPRALNQESNSADRFDWLNPLIEPSEQDDDFIIKIMDGDYIVIEKLAMELARDAVKLLGVFLMRNPDLTQNPEALVDIFAAFSNFFTPPEHLTSGDYSQNPDKPWLDEFNKIMKSLVEKTDRGWLSYKESNNSKPPWFNKNNRWEKKLHNSIYEAPATTLSINASFSLKIALRKLLNIGSSKIYR